jgi:hypothetical protein
VFAQLIVESVVNCKVIGGEKFTVANSYFFSFAEAICFGGTGYDLYTISEGEGARLFRLPYE